MRVLKRVLLVLVILVAVALLAANLYLGKAVKALVEKAGPSLVGVPLKLESAQFRLLQGVIPLRASARATPGVAKRKKVWGGGDAGG